MVSQKPLSCSEGAVTGCLSAGRHLLSWVNPGLRDTLVIRGKPKGERSERTNDCLPLDCRGWQVNMRCFRVLGWWCGERWWKRKRKMRRTLWCKRRWWDALFTVLAPVDGWSHAGQPKCLVASTGRWSNWCRRLMIGMFWSFGVFPSIVWLVSQGVPWAAPRTTRSGGARKARCDIDVYCCPPHLTFPMMSEGPSRRNGSVYRTWSVRR